MHIGNVEIPTKLALAPMAGVTDAAYRQICSELGAGLTYTELVSAKALCYQDKKSKLLLQPFLSIYLHDDIARSSLPKSHSPTNCQDKQKHLHSHQPKETKKNPNYTTDNKKDYLFQNHIKVNDGTFLTN